MPAAARPPTGSMPSSRAGRSAGTSTETVELLIAAGVPAATLTNPRNLTLHPHLVARGYLEHVPNEVVGTHRCPGCRLRMSGVDRWIRQGAPLVGEHNDEVLSGLLGLSDAELERLTAAGVIGTEPPPPTD